MAKYLLFSALVLANALLVGGCASGGEQVKQKELFIQVRLKGVVDSVKGVYWLAFETDNDSGDAPFFDAGDNLLNTDFYITFENQLFRKVIVATNAVSPYTSASSAAKILQYSVPLTTFGAVNVVDITFFTFQINGNQKILVDGLFDPHSDAQAIHFDLQNETTRSENDPDDSIDASLDFLDVQSLTIQLVES